MKNKVCQYQYESQYQYIYILYITLIVECHIGRKTLHGHWLLWVKNFNRLRLKLFQKELDTHTTAKEQLKTYVDQSMSSSHESALRVNHSCKNEGTSDDISDSIDGNSHNDDMIEQGVKADDLFFDYNENSSDKEDQLQRIRDTRSKHKKDSIAGKIMQCRKCEASFSTNEVVNMALAYHKEKNGSSVALPIHDKRLDIAAYRYPYDYGESDIHQDKFWEDSAVRAILLRQSVDEHDWRHRASCFKKGSECRFHFGKKSCTFTDVCIDAVAIDRSNVTTWFRLNQDIENQHIESTPYLIETRRPMGCQFLNTHSVPVSAVFGCNTNVQIGEPVHLYYNTAYAFKDTQKEDSDRFIRIGTQVVKRLQRMKAIALENATTGSEADVVEISGPDFSEGLSRILSGICANMSKAVCSSTMAHLIVSNDGSRFEYSHGFSNLLVSQTIDVLNGKEGRFRVRNNFSKTKKESVLWPDSTVDDYVHRDGILDKVCLYEFVAKYKKECKSFKQMKGTSDVVCAEDMLNNDDQIKSRETKKYSFNNEHPGSEFSYLQERKHEVIPVISLPQGSICRIEELEKDSSNPSASALEKREVYAKTAMIMFLPFRRLEELHDGHATYWEKLMESIATQSSFWKTGIEILHHMEDRVTAQKMKSAIEPLAKLTTYEKSDDEKGDRKRGSDEDDPNAVDFSLFDDDDDRLIDTDYHGSEGYARATERTNGHLIDLGKLEKSQLISARISETSSLFADQEEPVMTPTVQQTTQEIFSQVRSYEQDFPTLLKFIDGALVGGNYDSYLGDDQDMTLPVEDSDQNNDDFRDVCSGQRQIPSLSSVAKKIAQKEGKTLDKKQYIAYEIIACSFLLRQIEESAYQSSSALNYMTNEQKENLIKRLKARGGHEQLIMFLTGFAGAGKSTCVKIAQRFCFEFCRAVSIPWNDNTFLFTATTGSAASLFDGQTIHDAAFLNGLERNISNKKRQEWQSVRTLVIDEISFFTRSNLEKLDRQLKNILGRQDRPYGGISIVFSGDFHQLRPVKCEQHGILYEGIMNGLFEGNINTAIILENSHRFDEDPEFGALLKRMWKGEMTEDDIRLLNTRVVGQHGVVLPEHSHDADTCYACPFNLQRNATSAGIFREHLHSGLFPTIDSEDLPPEHTIIVEADIHSCSSNGNKEKTRVSRVMRDRIISTCGDSHAVTSQNKKVDPCLRMYRGCHSMCNDNSKLKSENVGNGTCCRLKSIKLKNGAPPLSWKNWDGVKVYTVSARYVEWAEFERFPDNDKIKSLKNDISAMESDLLSTQDMDCAKTKLKDLRKQLDLLREDQCFRLSPTKSTAIVKVTLDDNVNERTILKGVSITQLPINMNDATTGHKLQGMSKDKLIVVSWSFKPNWVYVVLSRVRTLKGLFLLKPLPTNCLDKFEVPRDLQAFEHRMQNLERSIIEARKRNMATFDLEN